MNNLLPLMRREWLQHRRAWMLLVLVPLALAVLPLAVGQIEFDSDLASRTGSELAVMLGTLSIVITIAVLFLLVWVSSVFITSGLARRDHADRSIEFWLSLPTGHAESLAAPLLVHLVLVPAAALVAGLLGGCAISLLLVTRFAGIGEWLGLPWGSVLAGTVALVLRVMAGLPLAALWLMPLVLLAILANAVFKRWGLPVLIATLTVGATLLDRVFGQPALAQALAHLGSHAATSLMGASGRGVSIDDKTPPEQALAHLPGWAIEDLGAALRDAASPGFLAALLVSALLFWALVQWRRRGAGLSG